MSKENDFVNEKLFKRCSKKAKRITFDIGFEEKKDKDKIEYLIKLASSLNHAAVQIQKERDQLNILLFEKERQLIQYRKNQLQDQAMIHKQLEIENITKNKQMEEIQKLYKEMAELKRSLK